MQTRNEARQIVPLGKAARGLSALVGSVRYGGARIVLTSRGRPAAVVVSVADLERLEASEVAR